MPPEPDVLIALQQRLADDLFSFAPELMLASTIVLVLLARLMTAFDSIHRGTVAIIAVAFALGLTITQWTLPSAGLAFSGLLKFDDWAVWFRGLILLASLLTLILARIHGLPDREDSTDYVVLLLGAALGLMMMSSANHLLMLFVAIEMASLPSAALAGFLKGRSTGSEAALKYIIYGAAASGVMLYGISLLTARAGTGYLPDVMNVVSSGFDLVTASGMLFVGVGLGYKLSIVPFHVWLPDVFEAAPAEIGAFLSTASKAAAIALTGRVLMLAPAAEFSYTLAILAAITATFGNLLAYAQSNLKRLLGYSTIAHAGFLLAGLAVCTRSGSAAAVVYLAAYLLANFGVFATVIAVKLMTGRDDVASLAGLMRRSPALGVGFALCILSLLGLPPLAGFAGKFLIFESLYDASRSTLSTTGLIVFGVLLFNTALGAGYYLKLLLIAVLDEGTIDGKASPALAVIVLLLGLGSVLLGVLWNPLMRMASIAAG